VLRSCGAGQLENAADSHAASLAPLISSCQQEVAALEQELEEGRAAAAQDHQEQTTVMKHLAEVRVSTHEIVQDFWTRSDTKKRV
jgi:hypothetical protein